MRALLLVCAVVGFAATATAQTEPTPLVNRIRMATIVSADAARTSDWYARVLGYRVVEQGKVDADLAKSWGAPKSAGRAYTLLGPQSGADVYVRVVAGDPAPGFKAYTTFGWGSVEIITDDLDKVEAAVKASGAEIIREKAPLDPPFATIHTMQVRGTAEEVVNLATEKGDRAKSNLPVPKSNVDRIFLISTAAADVDALTKYWALYKMHTFPRYDPPIPIAATALGLPATTPFPSTLVRSRDRGNTVELHAYPPPAKPRPHADGQLPPGVAIATFAASTLDIPLVKLLTPPVKPKGVAYGGKAAATTLGPAGELIELIQE